MKRTYLLIINIMIYVLKNIYKKDKDKDKYADNK